MGKGKQEVTVVGKKYRNLRKRETSTRGEKMKGGGSTDSCFRESSIQRRGGLACCTRKMRK